MRVLMCPPTYYEIPAIENTHMDPDLQPDAHKKWQQWVALYNLYQSHGVQVYLIPPEPRFWDLVFTANGAWGQKGEIVLANFRQPIRRDEKELHRRWLSWLGFKVWELPSHIPFEGQGSMMGTQTAYLFGHDSRSSPEAVEYLIRLLQLKKEPVVLRVSDRDFYHLDTCGMSLRPTNSMLYCPDAFDGASVDKLRKLPLEARFEVSKELGMLGVCNSVYLEEGQIIALNISLAHVAAQSFELSAKGVPLREQDDVRYEELVSWQPEIESLLKGLWGQRYTVIPVYTSEYKLSGAGCRCLTLFLD